MLFCIGLVLAMWVSTRETGTNVLVANIALPGGQSLEIWAQALHLGFKAWSRSDNSYNKSSPTDISNNDMYQQQPFIYTMFIARENQTKTNILQKRVISRVKADIQKWRPFHVYGTSLYGNDVVLVFYIADYRLWCVGLKKQDAKGLSYSMAFDDCLMLVGGAERYYPIGIERAVLNGQVLDIKLSLMPLTVANPDTNQASHVTITYSELQGLRHWNTDSPLLKKQWRTWHEVAPNTLDPAYFDVSDTVN